MRLVRGKTGCIIQPYGEVKPERLAAVKRGLEQAYGVAVTALATIAPPPVA
jgi:hypothetical protein